MDIPCGETVPQITAADVLQDGLGGRQLDLSGRAVDAPRVAFQVIRGRQRLEQRTVGNRPRPSVCQMIDQRKDGTNLRYFAR